MAPGSLTRWTSRVFEVRGELARAAGSPNDSCAATSPRSLSVRSTSRGRRACVVAQSSRHPSDAASAATAIKACGNEIRRQSSCRHRQTARRVRRGVCCRRAVAGRGSTSDWRSFRRANCLDAASLIHRLAKEHLAHPIGSPPPRLSHPPVVTSSPRARNRRQRSAAATARRRPRSHWSRRRSRPQPRAGRKKSSSRAVQVSTMVSRAILKCKPASSRAALGTESRPRRVRRSEVQRCVMAGGTRRVASSPASSSRSSGRSSFPRSWRRAHLSALRMLTKHKTVTTPSSVALNARKSPDEHREPGCTRGGQEGRQGSAQGLTAVARTPKRYPIEAEMARAPDLGPPKCASDGLALCHASAEMLWARPPPPRRRLPSPDEGVRRIVRYDRQRLRGARGCPRRHLRYRVPSGSNLTLGARV